MLSTHLFDRCLYHLYLKIHIIDPIKKHTYFIWEINSNLKQNTPLRDTCDIFGFMKLLKLLNRLQNEK